MDEYQQINLLGGMSYKEVEQYFVGLEKIDNEQAKRERRAFRDRYGFWPPRAKKVPKEKPNKNHPNQQSLFMERF